ncbi:hypothetical protein DMX10_02445 [Pseudomonas sp. 57B-090624]|nr:hypothetical protein DMX10_02445 [Pseudomonas sp. 57B-090624]
MRRIFCRRFEPSISPGLSALSRKSDGGIAESVNAGSWMDKPGGRHRRPTGIGASTAWGGNASDLCSSSLI